MPESEKQAYSLLQLRLSRTESFFKNHNGTDLIDFFDLPLTALDQHATKSEVTSSPSKSLKPSPAVPPRQQQGSAKPQQIPEHTSTSSKYLLI